MTKPLTYDQELETFLFRSVRTRKFHPHEKHHAYSPNEFKAVGCSYVFPPEDYEARELNSITLRDLITNEDVFIVQDGNKLFSLIKAAFDELDAEAFGSEVSINTIESAAPWYFNTTDKVAII